MGEKKIGHHYDRPLISSKTKDSKDSKGSKDSKNIFFDLQRDPSLVESKTIDSTENEN